MARSTMPIAANPRPAIDLGSAARFARIIPSQAARSNELMPTATVTIDDRSESGAWARALRDTPHIDRQLGRMGE